MAAMIDRQTWSAYVKEALVHLQDRPFLDDHPLLPLVTSGGRRSTGDDLRRALLDAIDQLRPELTAPAQSIGWRRHRHLVLRHVDGHGPVETARKLQVSLRQAQRDHADALEAVTAVLWNAYRRQQYAAEATENEPAVELTALADVPLDTEVDRLALQQAEGPASVGDTLSGAMATVRRMADDHGVVFTAVDVAPSLSVNLSRPVLRQVLVNVLSYIVESYPNSQVSITFAEVAPFVRIRLEIDPRVVANVSSPSTHEAQVLLGVAHKLLESQGGVLRADVSVGDPGAILLDLPASPTAYVLVIDDNPDLVGLFRRYLRGQGYRLVQVTTGQRALRIIAEAPPDVILLDVLMPTQDGWEILQELRGKDETRGIPVIVCSVLPDHTLALSLGATGFLPKPVTEVALRTALARYRPPAAGGLTA
jgi:CheY-like chemotaxis protein